MIFVGQEEQEEQFYMRESHRMLEELRPDIFPVMPSALFNGQGLQVDRMHQRQCIVTLS